MTRLALLAPTIALAGCTAVQTDRINATVKAGQLYCAMTTATGPLVVALANTSGVPVKVTDRSAAEVAAACALIGAIPVVPPPNPAAAPIVAAKTTLPAA